MTVGDAARSHIQPIPDAAKLRQQALQDGLRPLRLAGAMKVAEGVTTLEEVLRATPAWEGSGATCNPDMAARWACLESAPITFPEGCGVKIKSQRDFWSGLMFVVVGATFAIGATNYSMGTSARPGAGYFPLMLSVIMAILGAIVLLKSWTSESPGGDPVGGIAWKPLLIIVVAIAVFGI